jgi:hypothetical protein
LVDDEAEDFTTLSSTGSCRSGLLARYRAVLGDEDAVVNIVGDGEGIGFTVVVNRIEWPQKTKEGEKMSLDHSTFFCFRFSLPN